MFDDYDIREQDTLDNIAEYAESKTEFCPDCDSEITFDNYWIDERHNPETCGSCVACYDPSPLLP